MNDRIEPSYNSNLVDDFFHRHGPFQRVQFLRGPLDGLKIESSNFTRKIVLPINAEIVDRPELLVAPSDSNVPPSSVAVYQLAVLNDKLYYAFRGGASADVGE